jgi:nucleoid-associated protein YgaU
MEYSKLIIKGSRYKENTETRNEDTKVIAEVKPYTTSSYFSVVTQQYETFASLAASHLKDPTLYWKIADLNKSLGYPDFIVTGTVIKVPFR